MASNSTSLYGAPRPKNKPIPLSSTSIHALSTELSLARSQLSKTEKSAPARVRPSKTSKLFSSNRGVASRAEKDLRDPAGRPSDGVSERELERSRKRLREKAKVYESLQRGEGDASGEVLVNFDRKWAEEGFASSSSSSSEDEGEGGGGLVEYEDEFGRTRMGTRAEKEREERKNAVVERAETVRPEQPAEVIYGNMIQAHAFQTLEFSTVPKASELAAALLAAEEEEVAAETHYDATKEVRTKGVGFYQFSKDAGVRREEMEKLERERERTLVERREKEERRKRKREEIEKRKEEVRAKRRGKVGGSWLEEQFGGGLEKLGE